MAVETEIKFRITDLAALSERLTASGFHLETPRSFESNILFDTPSRTLRMRTEILRIRQYNGKCILTHKRIPDSGIGEDRHKHRIETETQIEDGDALAMVFKSLNLLPTFHYEKWRTEWRDGVGHCVVDETPIGNYAELEGTSEWIDQTAQRLGVPREEYLTISYGRLFDQWRIEHNSLAENLTFAAISEAERGSISK